MSKRIALVAVAVAFLFSPLSDSPVRAGGGGGGSTKPVKVVYIGYITHLELIDNGILVTVGTSYYNIAANILITSDTKVKYNGVSISALELEVGDYAEITVEWPSKSAIKVEAIGTP